MTATNSLEDAKTALWEARAEIERLRALLQKLDWKSIDKDNMEFSCRVPYNVMDETRRALETKPCQPGLIPDERVEGPRPAKEPKP
jgi:hypothetical protein